MSDMDKLAEMVAALTPGPWRHRVSERDASYAHIQTADRNEAYIAGDAFPEDAAGIVVLRNLAPELMAVVRAADAQRRAWHAEAGERTAQGVTHAALRALDAKLAEVLRD